MAEFMQALLGRNFLGFFDTIRRWDEHCKQAVVSASEH
jgi:hypothetical protein